MRMTKVILISFYDSFLITLQGTPTATHPGGISLLTTLPAPMVTLSPIVTPGSTVTPAPIHTLLPIVMGRAYSRPLLRNSTSSGCPAVVKQQPGPIKTLSPNTTGAASRITRLWLA